MLPIVPVKLNPYIFVEVRAISVIQHSSIMNDLSGCPWLIADIEIIQSLKSLRSGNPLDLIIIGRKNCDRPGILIYFYLFNGWK